MIKERDWRRLQVLESSKDNGNMDSYRKLKKGSVD